MKILSNYLVNDNKEILFEVYIFQSNISNCFINVSIHFYKNEFMQLTENVKKWKFDL